LFQEIVKTRKIGLMPNAKVKRQIEGIVDGLSGTAVGIEALEIDLDRGGTHACQEIGTYRSDELGSRQ